MPILTGIQKPIEGKTIRALMLDDTVANSKHVRKGEVHHVSHPEFLVLKAYGKAQVAPPEPAAPLPESEPAAVIKLVRRPKAKQPEVAQS
jgi:hypothetical protein